MKKEMQKGDVQTFKTRKQFEAQEGPITAHTRLGHKVMFWTKDGTYTMTQRKWKQFFLADVPVK